MNILEAFKKLEQGEKVRPVEWGKENYEGSEMYLYNCYGKVTIQAREKEDCKAFSISNKDIKSILLGNWEVFKMDKKEQLKLDGMKFQLTNFCEEQRKYSFGCQNLDNYGCSWLDCKMYKTCYKKDENNKEHKIKDGLNNWDMLKIIETYQELNK